MKVLHSKEKLRLNLKLNLLNERKIFTCHTSNNGNITKLNNKKMTSEKGRGDEQTLA